MKIVNFPVEIVQWIDITERAKKDPSDTDVDLVSSYVFGIVIEGLKDKKSGMEVLRICYQMGKELSDRLSSDFLDVPLGNVVKREKVGEIKLEVL